MNYKKTDGLSYTGVAPAGGTLVGNYYVINGFFGPAFATVNAGEKVALDISQAEYRVSTNTSFALGDLVYFSAAGNFVKTSAAGARLVGTTSEPTVNGHFSFINVAFPTLT